MRSTGSSALATGSSAKYMRVDNPIFTPRVRVWHLLIPAGKRCNFHRHVLNYFWTAHTDGKARNYFEDGRIVDVEHYKGETKHLHFGPGEYLLHAVENIGSTDLLFTTVEFLDSANEPLPVADEMRLRLPEAA
jgi:hypothetical protein